MSAHPRHVICVLGSWKSFDVVERVIAAHAEGAATFKLDMDYSQQGPDDRMARAFAASADRVKPSMTDDDDAAIERHSAVAYILSAPLTPADAFQISTTTLALIDSLLDTAGALAVKGESAGIAHGAERWRALARRARSNDLLERATALRLAFVRRPIGDDEDELLYSCGMHLLGDRDVEVTASDDVHDDIGWLDLLATYMLAEKPARGISDGEGFRQEAGGERRILRAKPCVRYEADDFMFNPYGYWRLVDA